MMDAVVQQLTNLHEVPNDFLIGVYLCFGRRNTIIPNEVACKVLLYTTSSIIRHSNIVQRRKMFGFVSSWLQKILQRQQQQQQQ